jgi:hypothetical protein
MMFPKILILIAPGFDGYTRLLSRRADAARRCAALRACGDRATHFANTIQLYWPAALAAMRPQSFQGTATPRAPGKVHRECELYMNCVFMAR